MSRAFDTIDRGILLNDLKQILDPDTLHLVSLLLKDVQIQVKYKNQLGTTFTPDIGSPQGDCASPIWFIFYLHKALQSQKLPSCRDTKQDIIHDHNYTKDHKKSITPKNQKSYLIEQQYADDVSWITTSNDAKEEIKTTVPAILTNSNLIVNSDKTEEYSISRTTSDDSWKTCKYLGSLLGTPEDVKRRKQLACAAFNKNKKALCSNKISMSVRLRIFNALVATIFLYNSELWALTKKETKKIDTFQRNFLRQITRTKKRINNTSLYKKCKTVHWSIQIQERRLKWFGHLQRLPKETPARKAYDEATKRPVKKLRGGQPLTWHRVIERDLNSINSNTKDAIIKAQDRDKYFSEVVTRVKAKAIDELFPEADPQPTHHDDDDDARLFKGHNFHQCL